MTLRLLQKKEKNSPSLVWQWIGNESQLRGPILPVIYQLAAIIRTLEEEYLYPVCFQKNGAGEKPSSWPIIASISSFRLLA